MCVCVCVVGEHFSCAAVRHHDDGGKEENGEGFAFGMNVAHSLSFHFFVCCEFYVEENALRFDRRYEARVSFILYTYTHTYILTPASIYRVAADVCTTTEHKAFPRGRAG